MRLDIHTRGFLLTKSLRNYTNKSLQFALERNDSVILRAHVRLADINGPRGGIDKQCKIELALAGQNNIVVEDIQSDLYVAIDQASERCMHTLARRLDRSKQHLHEVFPYRQDAESFN